jgi:hypothetical protein
MEKRNVLIIGDVALDKNIYVGKRKSPETGEYGSQIIDHKGGSHLLYEIISKYNFQNNILKTKDKSGN